MIKCEFSLSFFLLCMVITGCVSSVQVSNGKSKQEIVPKKKFTPKEENTGRRKEEMNPDYKKSEKIPQQKVIAVEPVRLEDGSIILREVDVTGEYVTKVRKEFKRCLSEVFLEIAKRAFNREANIAELEIEEALKCYSDYFQAMKGGINLSEEDIRISIIEEEERQRKFYQALRELKEKFTREDVRFEILPPGNYHTYSGWNMELVAGCNIETDNGVYLSAFPLFPVQTSDYMTPSQGPVAARILYLNDDCMLFIQHDNAPGEKFWEVCRKFFGEPKDIRDELSGVRKAYLLNNILIIDSDKMFSGKKLEELRKKYQVTAVLGADSSQFTAFIYIGKDKTNDNLHYHFLLNSL